MIAFRKALAGLLLLLAACAPSAPPQPAASAPAQIEGAREAWWRDHRWRYQDDGQAEAAYRLLLTKESPWPDWHQENIRTLPVGIRFQMAFSPGQREDQPGGFGTFDHIVDVRYVRQMLAVKEAWKPRIDRAIVYEVRAPLPVDLGTVGPQIDAQAGRYLPGGGSQFQMQVPAAERMRHLRVVEIRELK